MAHTANTDGQTDAIVIGTGMAGLYAMHHLRGLGLSLRAFEAGSDVGGTWYWNRYPGCGVDFESLEYSYSFSEDLQQEWKWSARYAAQPELLEYFRFAADKFGLRALIQFNTRIPRADYDEEKDLWTVETERGERYTARYLIMTIGHLSAAPNKPDFPGLDRFEGEQLHTARWPEKPVDFSGKRVGLIGTGSSGVQVAPHIAETAAHLTVFQRTPGYCVPMRNHPMTDDYERYVKGQYAAWRHKERYHSNSGFIAVNYEPVEMLTKSALDATPEERREVYEARWKNGGLAFYNIYPDIFTDKKANDTLAEFLREKTRERIKDPALQAKLIPDYPVLIKRLIADKGYYEMFERETVSLVDVRETPIESFVPEGLKVGGQIHDLDAVVFATGFDAVTGPMMRMDVRGRGGHTMKEHWASGARSFLGLQCAGFPNMFLIDSVGTPATIFSPILLSEEQIRWVGASIEEARAAARPCVEVSREAEDEWFRHCQEVAEASLFPTVDSWYTGKNIPGKSGAGLIYFGGIHNYRAALNAAAAEGYAGHAEAG